MRMMNFCNQCNHFQCWHIGNLDFLVFLSFLINIGNILGYSRTEFQSGYNGYKVFRGVAGKGYLRGIR